MNSKRPTAIKGTMNRAKTSFSTEIFAGSIICVVHIWRCYPKNNSSSCLKAKAFATWSYATPTPLWLRGSAASLASTRGVCQGDLCAPLFFALALQRPLEELQELDLARHTQTTFSCKVLRGEGVEAAFPTVLESLGLQDTLSKCSAYSAAKADSASGALGIQHAVEGIAAAGTPVSLVQMAYVQCS
jgi:hypothetical protein